MRRRSSDSMKCLQSNDLRRFPRGRLLFRQACLDGRHWGGCLKIKQGRQVASARCPVRNNRKNRCSRKPTPIQASRRQPGDLLNTSPQARAGGMIRVASGWWPHHPPACAWGLLWGRGAVRAFPYKPPGASRGMIRVTSGWWPHHPPACAWGLLWGRAPSELLWGRGAVRACVGEGTIPRAGGRFHVANDFGGDVRGDDGLQGPPAGNGVDLQHDRAAIRG